MNKGPKGPMGPKKAPKGVLKKLIKMLFETYKVKLIIAFACVIITAICTTSVSIFLKQVIDTVITPYLNGSLSNIAPVLTPIIITMIVIGITSATCSFIQAQIMARTTQSFLYDLRVKVFKKMEYLPVKYFDQNPHGDIMSTYTNDIDALRQFISQTLIQIFNTVVTMSYLIFMMLFYSVWLTLVVICGVALTMFITKTISKKMGKHFKLQQKHLAHLEGYVEEMMDGQRVVKVFNHESIAKEEFKRINEELCTSANIANKNANSLMPILNNIGNILYIIVIIIGSVLVSLNTFNLSVGLLFGLETVLTVGTVAAFLTMSKSFSGSITQVSQQLAMFGLALAGADRIFKLLETDVETDDGYVTMVKCIETNGEVKETNDNTGEWYWKHPHRSYEGTTYHKVCGHIVLENVDFSYVPGKRVLNDVSVYAHPGEKIALVGSTGAGKTTITNLINRFYDIEDGKVRYDGININKIKKYDLRKSLGIVLQDTNLFTGTVFDNIKYGVEDATEEQVYEAAKLANAYDFITRLPDGFNTLLEHNGSNLSQGQRQLISIARAACADTPVMILDEATSSIDTRTERLVQKGMDGLMHGRTVFVIAHRLSTVRNSDCIMVLEHGKVIEKGNHDSLIKDKKTYYQLYTGAFEME